MASNKEPYVISLNGKKPIRFVGRLIGRASSNETAVTIQPTIVEEVKIFLTARRRFVGWTCNQCMGHPADRDAETLGTAEELVAFFEQEDGTFSSVALRALRRAAEENKAIEGALSVTV